MTLDTTILKLRLPQEQDLQVLFEQQRDPEYNHVAAFTNKDPDNWEYFKNHWAKIMADPKIEKRVIVFQDAVVGSMCKFEMFGKPQVCYGIDKKYWKNGLATQALKLFLQELTERPLYAQVACDNVGSIRVLEKCSFKLIGTDRGFANARAKVIEEHIFVLE